MARVVLWKSNVDIEKWKKISESGKEEIDYKAYSQTANEKYFDVLTKVIQLPNFMISYSTKKSNPNKVDIAWIRDDQVWWFPFLTDVVYYVDEGIFCREIKVGNDAIVSRFYDFTDRPSCCQLDEIMNGSHAFDDLINPIGNSVLQYWMDWYLVVDEKQCPIPLSFLDKIADEAWNYVPIT